MGMVSGDTQMGSAVLASPFPQTWMSASERTMQAVCMTVSTSLVTTDAPAMMDSTWHMMDTTVWVSKGGGLEGCLLGKSLSHARRRKVTKKELHSSKKNKASLPFRMGHQG